MDKKIKKSDSTIYKSKIKTGDNANFGVKNGLDEEAVKEMLSEAVMDLKAHIDSAVGSNNNPVSNEESQSLTAQELNAQGCRYYSSGDYKNAVDCFKKAAEQGNMKAQCNLGICYFNGKGVEKDVVNAAKWYCKSAEQGYARSQCWLGICYFNGEGVEKDVVNAAEWFRKSAEQGYADAQCWLGYCYYGGYGVTQDYAETVKWLQKAAEQGDKYAQYNLGFCYATGRGVAQDYAEAVNWYIKAAKQRYSKAESRLKKLGGEE